MLILGNYLAQPTTAEDGAAPGWEWAPPIDGDGLRGALNLASIGFIAACRPDQPRPLGLFDAGTFPLGCGSSYLPITIEDPRDARPDGRFRDAWLSITGVPAEGDTLAQILFRFLCHPAGPGFLQPTLGRSIEIWLSGRKIVSRKFVAGDDPDYDQGLHAFLRTQVAAAVADAEGGRSRSRLGQVDDQADARFVDWLAEKYVGQSPQKKAEFCELVQFEKPLVPHETTLSDNFDRANNTNMSTGGPYSYTDLIGDMQVHSNAAAGSSPASADCRSRLESDLSGSDHNCYVNATRVVDATTGYVAPCIRFQSGADTCYAARLSGSTSSITGSVARAFRAIAVSAGGVTALGTGGNQTSALPVPIGIEVNGSTLSLYYNGSLVETITDSSITSGTRVGLMARGFVDSKMDDLAAADLAPPAGHPLLRRLGGIPFARPWPAGMPAW